MDGFLSRKRLHTTSEDDDKTQTISTPFDDDSTDFKLAVLSSLHPSTDQNLLLEALLSADGSVDEASKSLAPDRTADAPRKETIGYQSSLISFARPRDTSSTSPSKKKALTRRGKTLHLYSPEDIENFTPCSIIHNFLPRAQADALLRELLQEVPSFQKATFKLFEREVSSPHTMAFYVDSLEEARAQTTDYVYNGSRLKDVRRSLPEMRRVSILVQDAVNKEIGRRVREHYPGGKKLQYQSPDAWVPNASFVNCYDGAAENVGYHSDQLTYIGPRAIIGSLSLGVAREFRVRRIVARDDPSHRAEGHPTRADAEGQIAIHLPHNSLLVMHAEMQEEWKHSISPSQAIDPHPVAGNKRINITYRCYKEHLNPQWTPKCRCNIPAVLRCVQKKKDNRGRYVSRLDIQETLLRLSSVDGH
ncbi:MAG: hypothetical protein M1822_005816 [Bathelium mastoideum]|nr:MAG: hypothetical protein M1822_005816 [Bathelium mastoideum]